MYNTITNKKFNSFLTKISDINFDKYYTPKRQLIFHFGMWVFFSILLFLNYYVGNKLSGFSSVLLVIRAIICNVVVFYLFFYLFPKFFFSSNKIFINIILLIFSFFLIIATWLLVNYLEFSVLYKLGFEIVEDPFKGIIEKNAKQTIWEAISFENIIGNANAVIFSFTPPFFVKILFDIIRLYGKLFKIEKQKSSLEIQNVNIEKEFLKAQLNPHFLFNTLNNLYGLSVKKDDSAPEVILNLSDIMAYTLYESNTEKVILQKELDFIENYFLLEKMRYSDEKDIQLQIEKNEDISGLYIAPLLTFTFIENAFKYGLKSIDSSFLCIFIQVSDDIFSFELKNDKNSNKTKEKQTNIGGIGTENVKKRLQLLYTDRHRLTIEDKENEFHVSLQIKLK